MKAISNSQAFQRVFKTIHRTFRNNQEKWKAEKRVNRYLCLFSYCFLNVPWVVSFTHYRPLYFSLHPQLVDFSFNLMEICKYHSSSLCILTKFLFLQERIPSLLSHLCHDLFPPPHATATWGVLGSIHCFLHFLTLFCWPRTNFPGVVPVVSAE